MNYNNQKFNAYFKAHEELEEKQAFNASKYNRRKPQPAKKEPLETNGNESPEAESTQQIAKRDNTLSGEQQGTIMKSFVTESTQTVSKKNNIFNEEHQILFDEAVTLYKMGLDGDRDSIKKSQEIFKKLIGLYQNNALVEGYLGCVTSLLGRDEFNPMERFKLAMKGVKMLDKAVNKEPDNVEIRNLRAYVCYRLPEMYFHKTTTAVEDFTYIVSRYEKDESTIAKEHYHQILFDLGAAFKELNRMSDAQKIWDKLLSVSSERKFVDMVKQAGGLVKENTQEIVDPISMEDQKNETTVETNSLVQKKKSRRGITPS